MTKRGPDYFALIDHIHDSIKIPFEFIEDFTPSEYIKWTANKDGTYTLVLFDKYN